MDLRKTINDEWVVHRTPSLLENAESILVGQTWPIRTVGGQRIEAVNDRQNAGPYWDVRSGKLVGVTASIPAFVVMPHDWNDWIREFDRGKNIRPDTRMKLHLLELGWSERARLVQNVLGDRKLAHIVEQCRGFDRADLRVICDPHRLRQSNGVPLNPPNVTVRDLVLRVDR